MLMGPGARDTDGTRASATALNVPYDTSLGDSCWVRQYLEWCDPAIAVAARKGVGFIPAKVHRFHAT